MKMSFRKRVGVGLLASSPVIALVLSWCGVPLEAVREPQTYAYPQAIVVVGEYEMQWPLVAIYAVAFLGFIFLIWPRRVKH